MKLGLILEVPSRILIGDKVLTRGGGMAMDLYVITEACIGTKDRSCVDVCPVDCIYEGEDQLFIHPDECINCGACEPECPVKAIYTVDDVPEELKEYIAKNHDVFEGDNPPGRPKPKGTPPEPLSAI